MRRGRPAGRAPRGRSRGSRSPASKPKSESLNPFCPDALPWQPPGVAAVSREERHDVVGEVDRPPCVVASHDHARRGRLPRRLDGDRRLSRADRPHVAPRADLDHPGRRRRESGHRASGRAADRRRPRPSRGAGARRAGPRSRTARAATDKAASCPADAPSEADQAANRMPARERRRLIVGPRRQEDRSGRHRPARINLQPLSYIPPATRAGKGGSRVDQTVKLGRVVLRIGWYWWLAHEWLCAARTLFAEVVVIRSSGPNSPHAADRPHSAFQVPSGSRRIADPPDRTTTESPSARTSGSAARLPFGRGTSRTRKGPSPRRRRMC